ncbi:hypothetical protein [Pseudodonghicola flavimaris]|uniref:Uncharacterized protein n=1 Tax=Pseudodonghicola flavimaris TaxID=3050036 RepID=A0ABT7EVZ7_9RHOB|nr:hypothetical protein [Pseudodonghicola flavimaris]MDK3016525.1 hypothetical protein [Pseudodonghicola flavimaris]
MKGRPIKNPRTERIAYQIHWLIKDTGGDCTLEDMAELSGESWQRCRAVAARRGLAGMYRTTSARADGDFRSADLRVRMDRELTELEAAA